MADGKVCVALLRAQVVLAVYPDRERDATPAEAEHPKAAAVSSLTFYAQVRRGGARRAVQALRTRSGPSADPCARSQAYPKKLPTMVAYVNKLVGKDLELGRFGSVKHSAARPARRGHRERPPSRGQRDTLLSARR